MILAELKEFAKNEGLVADPDYEPRPVRWVVEIGPGGRLFNVSSRDQPDSRGKSRPKDMQIPRSPVRTSGSVANFLVDKAEYVLGFDPEDKPQKRSKLATHRRLFLEYVERARVHAGDDPGLLALLDFLRDDDAVAGATEKVRSTIAANDLIAFRYRNGSEMDLIHDRSALIAAWKAIRHPASSDEVGRLPECLVCGESSPPIEVHPQVKRVPGGSTSGIAFVSANAPAFESFGLTGAEAAPVCRTCADAYGTALNRLFHPGYTHPNGSSCRRQSFRLSDDTGIIYWASAESGLLNELGGLDYADPEELKPLLEAAHKGKRSVAENAAKFSALLVTGGQGRATIRGYTQIPVAKLAGNLARYFDDIKIVPRVKDSPEYPALRWLVRSLAAQGKDKNVVPDLAGRLFLAIVRGDQLPASVLAAAVGRVRVERDDPGRGQVKHTRERLALIRMTLNRWFDAKDHRITPLIDRRIADVLDESCPNNAYCLGRLFAVLEKLQGEAIGKPNASIADRFYGAASATPATVFGTLLRKAQAHLGKMSGPYYAQKIQDVMKNLSPTSAFPPSFTLAEQGLFALGYYHQRADLWAKKDKPGPVAVSQD